MAGVLERHPGLRVLLAHGGGALPALRGRLRHAHSFQPQARSSLGESPMTRSGRFYFDTPSRTTRACFESWLPFAGRAGCFCGSDYPFDMGVARPAELVRALGLTPTTSAAILGGNALGCSVGGAAEPARPAR